MTKRQKTYENKMNETIEKLTLEKENTKKSVNVLKEEKTHYKVKLVY